MADGDADSPAGIDPRFDPAYQRGFEGTVGTTRRRPPVGTPSVVPAQELAPKPKPMTVTPQIQRPDLEPADERPVAQAPLPEEPDGRKVNPFLVALFAIAVVLIAVGIWGAMFANSAFQTNLTSSISYVTVLLVISSSAVSIGLGVATLIGIVFLYAARSLRRG